mgnify:CR=1 FL=1
MAKRSCGITARIMRRMALSAVLTAAETGHLVFATLHTQDAPQTIDRIIDALPANQREQTKRLLAHRLVEVVTQVLVKTADGRSRKAIHEIMIRNKAIARLIMSDQTHLIPSQLQTGKDMGMRLMDQALLEAIEFAFPPILGEVHRLPADLGVAKPEHRAFSEQVWLLPEGTLPPQHPNPVRGVD